MQISHILSDLTSLRACPPTAALALVHARTPTSTSQSPTSQSPTSQSLSTQNSSTQPPSSQNPTSQPSTAQTPSSQPPRLVSQGSGASDPDLQRATDLVELHEGVKMRHLRGLDPGLGEARREVEGVVGGLDGLGGA